MSQSPETQYSGSQKKEWNTTFSTVKSWKVDDRNEKKLFLNKQWTTKDGKKGNGKGATIPISIGNEVGMEIAKQCS